MPVVSILPLPLVGQGDPQSNHGATKGSERGNDCSLNKVSEIEYLMIFVHNINTCFVVLRAMETAQKRLLDCKVVAEKLKMELEKRKPPVAMEAKHIEDMQMDTATSSKQVHNIHQLITCLINLLSSPPLGLQRFGQHPKL